MRLPLILLICIFVLSLSVDIYIYRRLRNGGHSRAARVQLIASILLWLVFGVVAVYPKTAASDSEIVTLMWVIYGYLSIYLPKAVWCLFDLAGRIPALWHGRRWRSMPVIGAVAAIVTFVTMWWGALYNRTQIQLREVTFESPRVPAAFDGYRIVQISDIHTGTYGSDTAHLGRMVREINALHPDLVVFTGDIVNRRSSELKPHMRTLGGLRARDGVWSVLGNHDYGHYYSFGPVERRADVALLKQLQERMGWRMLDNAHTPIVRGADTLMLIGVGNIGDPPFKNYGDIALAYPTPADSLFKVLLSHNPSNWEHDIQNKPDQRFDLTLSGHTHAMQAEIAGWSPCVFRYREWGGMYADSLDRKLYVNIGMGTVGFPARIGATPEITLITLHRTK